MPDELDFSLLPDSSSNDEILHSFSKQIAQSCTIKEAIIKLTTAMIVTLTPKVLWKTENDEQS